MRRVPFKVFEIIIVKVAFDFGNLKVITKLVELITSLESLIFENRLHKREHN